ncbi:hypothetical protein D3C85_1671560 [compost metagenome]
MLDTVKPAEDGQGIILRFYESSGGRETVKLNWPYTFMTVSLSNALEEPGEALEVEEDQIELSFAPYEIVTILIQ